MRNNIKLLILIIASISLFRCSNTETDIEYNSSIKGQIMDNEGTPLSGDINSNTLVVKLLGVGDKQAIEVRADGNGQYQNIKIYPKSHKVWLEGPIVKSDTVTVDLAANSNQTFDFKVTPLLSPKITSGTANGTTISVNYNVVLNAGNVVKKMEIYCSTVKFPTASTGSLTNVYFTKKLTITALSGSVLVDGLTAGTKYFIRIGAQAGTTSLMNYSNQIEVSTP